MHSVDITLADEKNNFDTHFHLPIESTTMLHVSSLANVINIVSSDAIKGDWLKMSNTQALSMMDNEMTDLVKEINEELKKSKLLMKEKFPIRTKIEFIKTILRKPTTVLFGLVLMVFKKKKK